MIVVERSALGAGQSIASQGIIHGGVKYALGPDSIGASRALAGMPAVWRACLRGEGPVDLSGIAVLSERQLLWATPGLVTRLAGAAASRALRARAARVPAERWPEVFRGAPRGLAGIDVYEADECVLDPAGVLAALARRVTEGGGVIVRAEVRELRAAEGGRAARVWVSGGGRTSEAGTARAAPGRELELEAGVIALTAGTGNEGLLALFGRDARARMQRRPLHMVVASSAGLPELFGHCVGPGSMPRLTVTSRRDAAGRMVWYLGGALAEEGVGRGVGEQVEAARAALRDCLPWMTLPRDVDFRTRRLDRAEAATGTGARPDGPAVLEVAAGVLAAWPTKLAFAPLVGERILQYVRDARGGREAAPLAVADRARLDSWPRPSIAALPWDAPDTPE